MNEEVVKAFEEAAENHGYDMTKARCPCCCYESGDTENLYNFFNMGYHLGLNATKSDE